MSRNYIPPHIRNRIQKTEPKKEVNLSSENFPSLGGNLVRSNAGNFNKTKSFASLARDWNEHSEEEKLQREIHEIREQSRVQRDITDRRSHFTYYKQDEDVESNYDVYENQVESPKKDEWELVDNKKYRPELTVEQKIEREDKEEQEERQQKEKEDSVWNTEQWDYRDRRSYT